MPCKARPKGPLTWEELRSQIDYDPLTGVVTWKVAKPRIHIGMRAGNAHKGGFREIVVCGKIMREHRAIWWWMTGEDPGDLYIDHKNRVRNDNRWNNLRLATHGQNYVNSMQFGEMRGVVQRGDKWRVRIGVNGHRYTLGNMDTVEEAISLRQLTEIQVYGEFACQRN